MSALAHVSYESGRNRVSYDSEGSTLAAKGFVTLAFDPRGFGESAGRRQLEDPLRIVEDTRNSLTFLESHGRDGGRD